jgi:hypothetical protein
MGVSIGAAMGSGNVSCHERGGGVLGEGKSSGRGGVGRADNLRDGEEEDVATGLDRRSTFGAEGKDCERLTEGERFSSHGADAVSKKGSLGVSE